MSKPFIGVTICAGTPTRVKSAGLARRQTPVTVGTCQGLRCSKSDPRSAIRRNAIRTDRTDPITVRDGGPGVMGILDQRRWLGAPPMAQGAAARPTAQRLGVPVHRPYTGRPHCQA